MLMKISTLIIGLSLISTVQSFAQIENEDNPKARIKHEINMTIDPKLGRVPYERLIAEREKLHEGLKNNSIRAAITGLTWYERGPNNIGGRTRAVMFDPNDITKKRVWAAGVGGGLWYNNDITMQELCGLKLMIFGQILQSVVSFTTLQIL